MLQLKTKLCNGCQLNKNIWKSLGKNKYCLQCWNKHPEKNTPIKKVPNPINKKSDKKQKLDLLYKIIRDKFMSNHIHCQAGIAIASCSGKATECHHMAGKIGKLYLDDSKFLAVCHQCHRWITDFGKEAIELGFSETRLDK